MTAASHGPGHAKGRVADTRVRNAPPLLRLFANSRHRSRLDKCCQFCRCGRVDAARRCGSRLVEEISDQRVEMPRTFEMNGMRAGWHNREVGAGDGPP